MLCSKAIVILVHVLGFFDFSNKCKLIRWKLLKVTGN